MLVFVSNNNFSNQLGTESNPYSSIQLAVDSNYNSSNEIILVLILNETYPYYYLTPLYDNLQLTIK